VAWLLGGVALRCAPTLLPPPRRFAASASLLAKPSTMANITMLKPVIQRLKCFITCIVLSSRGTLAVV